MKILQLTVHQTKARSRELRQIPKHHPLSRPITVLYFWNLLFLLHHHSLLSIRDLIQSRRSSSTPLSAPNTLPAGRPQALPSHNRLCSPSRRRLNMSLFAHSGKQSAAATRPCSSPCLLPAPPPEPLPHPLILPIFHRCPTLPSLHIHLLERFGFTLF